MCRRPPDICSGTSRSDQKKSKAIVFGTSHTIRIFKQLQISTITSNDASEQTEFVDEVLCLGVILDSSLSWEPQINHITKKLNKSLFGVRFIQPCTALALRKRLVESLVLPHLDYSLWSITMPLPPSEAACRNLLTQKWGISLDWGGTAASHHTESSWAGYEMTLGRTILNS